MTDEKIEHGAAEDASGTPVTPTDVETSERPASEPADRAETEKSDDPDPIEPTD